MDAHKFVDICINTKGAVSDVAMVGAKLLRDKFRYAGDNTWEYKSDDGQTWILDDNREKVEMAIKVDVCQVFMERALFWQDRSIGDTEISEKVDCQLRSQFILQICLKFRKDKFVRDVLKELRAFLVVDDDGERLPQ